MIDAEADKKFCNASLRLDRIHRTFVQGYRESKVLRGASLIAEAGEIVAVVGPSGSGKSTLLQIAGLLEPPTSGKVFISGNQCDLLPESRRAALRRNSIGFVYQSHNLLPEFSALENVVMPQIIAGRSRSNANRCATDLLTKLGLSDRLTHLPSRLSGGEQQRTAIARAIANVPQLLLADEPTGNLDVETSRKVFDELVSLVRGGGLAAVIATHDRELASAADRTFLLREGNLISQ